MLRVLVLLAAAGAAQAQPPKLFPVDDAMRQAIEAKRKALAERLAPLRGKDGYADAAIYAKAAEWVVRYDEFYTADAGTRLLATLDVGLARATQLADGKTPWRAVRGKPTARAFVSKIDGSLQPYSVTLPNDYPRANATYRVDIALHGRDNTLTEAKFLQQKDGAKPGNPPADRITFELFGRGNVAYRWAAEEDFTAAEADFWSHEPKNVADPNRRVLRGFSMGGAGTWHYGLHHPFDFAAIQPGAGFTTTHGYIKNLPALPDFMERTLRIYDAVEYAENARSVPVVAYSGANDPQKAAADNIAKRLPEHTITHLVAPGLEHKLPPEWAAKVETAVASFLPRPMPMQELVFTTHTARYSDAGPYRIDGLYRHYDRAQLTAKATGAWAWSIHTKNVRRLAIRGAATNCGSIRLDGQAFSQCLEASAVPEWFEYEKVEWLWQAVAVPPKGALRRRIEKTHGQQGPIDDAFMDAFAVVAPAGGASLANEALVKFRREWGRYFRADLPELQAAKYPTDHRGALVLFGDPGSNPLLAEVLPKLPITWTRETLTVNGVTYDPATHYPAMIFPDPLRPSGYVVLNSGHTFHEADHIGTNANLYPRLGDWAVMQVLPGKPPQVVAAGLFDEFWKFQPSSLVPFVAAGAKLEKVWGDGEFTEGPALGPDGGIYFSDIGNRIMKYDPKTGPTAAHRDPGGRTNGLAFHRGKLFACEGANAGGGRRISVTSTDGKVTTLADKWNGKRFNSPNDLALDRAGNVYFTDPRYVGTEPREIDTESVYRIDTDGNVTQIIADIRKPNGIAFSPDFKTLYVTETDLADGRRGQLLAYSVADGKLGPKKVLYEFEAGEGIDGMKVSRTGVIVAAVVGPKTGVSFFDAAGKKLGHLPTPEVASNVCFGDLDRKVLYITAGKSLYCVRLTLTGP